MVRLKLIWFILFFTCIGTAIFSGVISFNALGGGKDISIIATIVLSLASFLVLFLDLRYTIFIIGFLLPTAPALGDGPLDLIISFWILGIVSRLILSIKPFHIVPYLGLPHPYITRGLICFNLIFMLGFYSSYGRFAFELNNFSSSSGIWGLFEFAINSTDSTLRALKLLVRSILFTSTTLTLLYCGQVLCQKRIRAFLTGLLGGLIISGVFALAQSFGINFGLLSSYNINLHIWLKLERVGGLFSDPNSYGVFVALAIPLIVLSAKSSGYKKYFLWSGGVVFFLSLVSGSRTELIGVFLFSCFYLYSVLAANISVIYKRGLVFSALFLGFALVFIEPFNQFLIDIIPLSSVQRLLDTLNYKNLGETLYSRAIYLRMTQYVWFLSPIVGVGLGRFHDLQSDAADALGINLASWRDNSNNFYMGVLAEEGMIGFILLLIGFFYIFRSFQIFKIKYDNLDFIASVYAASRVSLIIFVILLITGPHVYFQEICYLVAILISFASINGKFTDYKFMFTSLPLIVAALALIFVSLITLRGSKYEYSGFYDLEKSGSAYFRWSEKRSRFAVCNLKGEDHVFIKAITPSIEIKPIEVQIDFLDNRNQEVYSTSVILSDTRWIKIIIPEYAFNGKPYVMASMEVDRTWKPNEAGYSHDSRQLGVMLKWGESVCLR